MAQPLARFRIPPGLAPLPRNLSPTADQVMSPVAVDVARSLNPIAENDSLPLPSTSFRRSKLILCGHPRECLLRHPPVAFGVMAIWDVARGSCPLAKSSSISLSMLFWEFDRGPWPTESATYPLILARCQLRRGRYQTNSPRFFSRGGFEFTVDEAPQNHSAVLYNRANAVSVTALAFFLSAHLAHLHRKNDERILPQRVKAIKLS